MVDVHLTLEDARKLGEELVKMIGCEYVDGVRVRFGDSAEGQNCECVEVTPKVETVTVVAVESST